MRSGPHFSVCVPWPSSFESDDEDLVLAYCRFAAWCGRSARPLLGHLARLEASPSSTIAAAAVQARERIAAG